MWNIGCRGTASPRRLFATFTMGVCVVAAGSVTAEPADAAPESVACGAVLTADTRLQSDLLNCPGNGLVIGSDDITIDLAGHTVDGLGSAAPFGSAGIDNGSGHDDVVVKNGVVREFDEGVVLAGTAGNVIRALRVSANRSNGLFVDGFAAADSHDNKLLDNRIIGNSSDGLALRGSDHNTIRGNVSRVNGVRGISLTFSSQRNSVHGNVVSGNSGQGVLLLDLADDNDVALNRITDNGLAGVLVAGSNRNRVVANTVTSNAEGVDLLAGDRPLGSDDNVLARNLVGANTGDGIFVYGPSEFMGAQLPGATGTVVLGNVTNGNGDDGIDARSTATTITRNGADHNGDLGIDAVAGVVDGGGNHAAGNGDPLQCVNVACS